MTYASEVTADSPVLWWRLGEASGTTATDASGNGRHGSYAGSPGFGMSGLVTGADTAVELNGDRVSYAGTVNAGSAGASIELWYQQTVADSGYAFEVTGTSTNMSGVLGPTSSFDCNPTGSGSTGITGVTGLADGSIHHIVLTWDDVTNTLSLYVDGTLRATAGGTSGTMNISSVSLGSTVGGGTLLTGTYDEFAIYNTALSSTRVAAHYTAGSPPAPIAIHPNKITSTGTVHAPAIVPYIPPPVDGNLTITAELTPATKYAACIQPDRSAEIEPARHVAGVNAT